MLRPGLDLPPSGGLDFSLMTKTTRSFLLVCSGTFTGFLTIGIPLPVIPDYVHDQLGFDMVITGAAIGLQSLATVLTRKFAGHRADTLGSRPTARLGLLVGAGSGVIYLLSTLVAPFAAGLALIVFLMGRLTLGLAESLLLTGNLTWGIGLIGSKNSGKVMSWNGIAMHAALALGAPVGIFVRGQIGFTAVTGLAIFLPLVGFACTHFVPAAATSRTPALEVAFARTVRAIWAEGVGLALGTVGFGALSAFIAVYFRAQGWPFAGQGLLIFGGCYIAVRLVFGNLPDRIGGLRVAAISLAIEATGQTLLWLAPNPWVALVGVALTGAGFSLLFPSFGVQALKRVPPERKGTALGAFSAFFDVALGSTGPICGVVIASYGAAAIYAIGAGAALTALGLVVVAGRTSPGRRRAA